MSPSVQVQPEAVIAALRRQVDDLSYRLALGDAALEALSLHATRLEGALIDAGVPVPD